MILNISGRTDIVAFYTSWLRKRYQEGFVDVRNPFYPNLVSRILFEDVDLILFCTKNPHPIIPYLKEFQKPIIFQITLTPYKKDIEPNVPPKGTIIEDIKKLSKIIGKENLYIRYDPVFLNDRYTIDYHKKAFENLCGKLEGYVEKIIISFIEMKKNVEKNAHFLKLKPFTEEDYKEIGISFSKSVEKHGMTVQTCFTEHNLVEYGFIKDDCLSHTLAFKLTGKTYPSWNARKGNLCKCVRMVDIGDYNSCSHFCKYCYANYDEKKVLQNKQNHDPNSSLLIGHLKENDIIKIRKK